MDQTRHSRNRTECARPRAQQDGTVEGHRYDPETQARRSLPRPGWSHS